VNHEPVHPAVGYRFDHAGRSVVVSGDTAKSPNLVRVAQGADVLVHEAMSPDLIGVLEAAARESGRTPTFLFRDLRSFHTTPWDAADEATAAGVRTLAFTHFIPPVPMGALDGPFLGDARRRFTGRVFVTRDGDLITLRAGAATVEQRNLLD
jgi:ribonuclease Z